MPHSAAPESAARASSVWRFDCPDWQDRLRDGRSLAPDLPIDDVKAAAAVEIFNRLRIPDVAGQPTMREGAGEWFRDIVRLLFGSLTEDGERRVPEIFCLVPKKNGKTTYSAGVMMTALVANQTPFADFLILGPTHNVADLSFEQAANMVKLDDYLDRRFLVRHHVRTIEDRLNGAKLRIKTFDLDVMVGAKPMGVLVDELHLLSEKSYASRVLGQIRGGLLPKPGAFLMMITTQSDEPPAGVFETELKHARAIRDGRISGDHVRMLPVLYEFPEAMQTAPERPWLEPANWPMVLPNLGRSITLPRLVADFEGAKERGEHELRRWASQHLNVQIGLGLHSERWRGADYWEAAADVTLDFATLLKRSEVVVMGADGGGLDDLFGVAFLGRCRESGRWLAWHRAWAQSDVLTRRKDIAERLRGFEADGDLVVCSHATQDVDEIAALAAEVASAGLFPERGAVGVDPQGIADLVEALRGVGLAAEQIAAVPQGYRLTGAVWTLERKLKDGTFVHGGRPLMNWIVGNAKAEQRDNAVVISKAAAGKAKIDPLIATFNAAKMLERAPEALGQSFWMAGAA